MDKMKINLNESGSRSLEVEVTKENNFYVAKKITSNLDGVKTPVRLKTPKRAKTYEMLFRSLHEAFKEVE